MASDLEVRVKESIEMELFSSEESCLLIQNHEHKAGKHQRHLDHPLAPGEEEPGRRSLSLGRRLGRQTLPVTENQENQEKEEKEEREEREEKEASPGAEEDMLIEMEVLHSLKKSKYKTPCEPTAGRLKWKKLPQNSGRFVVKDLVFLPRDEYLAQIESHVFSQRREVSPLTARMTVDSSWSAAEMDTKLKLVLRRQFGKAAARNITFTYLQCVQSSRCLFIPLAPGEGWNGAHVLQVSALGPLYLLIHQETSSSQVEGEKSLRRSEKNRRVVPEIHKDNDASNTRSEELRKELQSVLASFTQETPDVELPLQVRRTAVLSSALKAVRKSGFCFRDVPIVSFSGEETEGHQGAQREFFRLMLQELQETSLFEGPPGRLLLTSDLSALEEWGYYEAGVLIGWSLAHGGTGPRFLHPVLFQLMCGHCSSLDDFSWRDVADFEIQSHLQQLQSCSDARLLSPSLCEWASHCGAPEISSATTEEIPNIYSRVVKHYMHDRVSRTIEQFTQGLNSCDGLWDVMRSHREAFAPVMTSVGTRPLTLPNFTSLFTASFSSDCEELKEEEETAAHWETALGLISDGGAALSFEDLLIFVSGLDQVPPLGFSSSITLRFYSQDSDPSILRLPSASTCTLELFLPRRVGGAVELLELLTRAVRESVGFTCLSPEDRCTGGRIRRT
ncbi:uncharacterized protein LOC129456170 [Periophthalmus magnuspinnatus]|uniref:uncharacterized protein LOC129456170 n=1 Tax=Periophthalmus magnuspinnatus TaxID=409849 RepID=UPI0024366843|nr:uncharacterized protein LOC129456170 [Periophthalmus magnuspinnatus]